jgi:hypothetical protein
LWVEDYAEARAAVEDLRRRRQGELVSLPLRDPPAPAADLAAAARSADWQLPGTLAAIACADDDLGAVAGRLPAETLMTVFEGSGCILLADPEGPGRLDQLRRAASKALLAVGPATEPSGASKSWRLAKDLLFASESGAVCGDGLLRVENHLADLLLATNPHLTSLLAGHRLAPLEGLTRRAGERMRETALAHVRHHGNAVAMAAELHVHPQTARYRIARLRELFGEDLDDPDARFELELALRASR